MTIGFTTIKVKDLTQSENFYQKYLDLNKMRSFSPDEKTTITFLSDEEGNLLELLEDQSLDHNFFENNSSLVSIGVKVDNLENIKNNIEQNNIDIKKGPIKVPSGAKMFFIEDPNGVEIEFIEGFEA